MAACGSSGPKLPIATQVCQGSLHAIRGALRGATVQILDRDPANIECLLSGDGATVDVVAEASPRAWEQFDTVVVHAAQANSGGSVNLSANLPQDVAGLGYNAAWIAVSHQFVATNGTQSSGGSYVTVTIKHPARHGPTSLSVAERVATATLKVAPRGPSPGPAPS